MTAATTVWHSEVKYFSKIRQGPHVRGLLEYAPKKLVREKVIANLARYLLATASEVPEHLLLFSPGDRLNSALLKQLLPEIYHVEICADADDDVIALFGQPDGSYVTVSSCTAAQKFPQNLYDAAKSLHMFIPDLVQATNDFLGERLKILEKKIPNEESILQALVMQDGASKFHIPEFEAQSVRAAARLLKNASLSTKQPANTKTSLEAPMGGGFYSLIFDLHTQEPASGDYKHLAAKRLRLNTNTHSFDNLPLIVFAALQWIEEVADIGIEKLTTLKILSPYASVAMQLIRLFEQETKTTLNAERIDIDQFILGWQKNLPLMELLSPDTKGPTLLLQVDQFPVVDLALVW